MTTEVDQMRAKLDDLAKVKRAVWNVLPKEKKLKAFSGTDGQSVRAFIEDVRATLKVRTLEAAEDADFIMAHLEEAARQEIHHRPSEVATDSANIVEALQDTFWERRTLGGLTRDLCNLTQKEGES